MHTQGSTKEGVMLTKGGRGLFVFGSWDQRFRVPYLVSLRGERT